MTSVKTPTLGSIGKERSISETADDPRSRMLGVIGKRNSVSETCEDLLNSESSPEFIRDHFLSTCLPTSCSEGIVNRLLACLWFHKNTPEKAILLNLGGRSLEGEILFLIAELSVSLEKEGFLDPSFDDFEELEMALETIKNAPLDSFYGDFAETPYKKLLYIIRPLNEQQLLLLLYRTKMAESRIVDKKVVLLLGNTGAGKSTTTHFLSGSTFRVDEINGSRVINADQIFNPDAENVLVGIHQTISATRYISSVSVIPGILDGDIFDRGTEEVCICDTPGFLDSRGPEVQIASGQGIVDAVKKTKCVWPVLLIPVSTIGDRWMGFRDFVRLIVDFIPSMKVHARSFTYIFTSGWDNKTLYPDPRRFIYTGLKELRDKGLEEKDRQNKAIVDLLDDMVRKTRLWNNAFILDPVNPSVKPGDLLYHIINQDAITDCENSFRHILNSGSAEAISKQNSLHKRIIMHCLSPEVLDFDIINYHLTVLKILKDRIPRRLLKDAYLDCREEVENQFMGYIEDNRETLLEQFTCPKIWQAEEEVAEFRGMCSSFKKILMKLDAAREKLGKNPFQNFLTEFGDATAKTTPNLVEMKNFSDSDSQLMLFDKSIKICVVDLISISEDSMSLEGIDFPLIKARMDRLRAACVVFPRWKTSYDASTRHLSSRYRNSFELLQKNLASWEIPEALTQLNSLKAADGLLRDHFLHLENYETSIELFLHSVEKKANELSFTSLTAEQLKLLEKNSDNLALVVTSVECKKHFHNDEITKIHEEFMKKVIQYVHRLVVLIDQATKDGGTAVGQVKNTYDELLQILAIASLTDFRSTRDAFKKLNEQAKNSLEKFVAIIVKASESSLPDLLNRSATEGSNSNLALCLRNVKDASWIENYRPDAYEGVSTLKERVISCYASLFNSVKAIELTVHAPDVLVEVFALRTQLEVSTPIVEEMTDLAPIVREAKSQLYQKRTEVLKSIRELMKKINLKSEEGKDDRLIIPQVVIKVRRYFDYCERFQQTDRDERALCDEFNEFVSNYLTAIQEQMIINFEVMKTVDPNNVDEKKMQETVNSFIRRLKELRTFCDYEIDKEFYSYWCESTETGLLSHLQYLNANLLVCTNGGDIRPMVIATTVCGYLLPIDYLLVKEPKKFTDLRNEYFRAMNELGANYGLEIDRAMQADDFASVRVLFETLQQVNDPVATRKITSGKMELEKRLSRLKVSVDRGSFRLARDFNTSEMYELIENLRKIRSALTSLASYIEPVAGATIDHAFFVRTATNLYSLVLKYQDLKTVLAMNNFEEAENRKEQVANILYNFKEAELTVRYDPPESKTEVPIDSKKVITEMQSEISEYLRKLEKRYETLDIENYVDFPPKEIYAALKDKPKAEEFRECWLTIQKFIKAKIEAKIIEVKSSGGAHRDKLANLRQVETAVKMCPDTLQVQLLVNTDSVKQDMEAAYTYISTNVRSLLHDKEPSRLVSAYNEAATLGHVEAMSLIKNGCEEDFKAIKSSIKDNTLEAKLLVNIISYFQKLMVYQKERIANIVPTFETYLNSSCEIVRTGFIKVFTVADTKAGNSNYNFNNNNNNPGNDPNSNNNDNLNFSDLLVAFNALKAFQQQAFYSLIFQNPEFLTTFISATQAIRNYADTMKFTFIKASEMRDIYLTLSTYARIQNFDQYGELFRSFARGSASIGSSSPNTTTVPAEEPLNIFKELSTIFSLKDAHGSLVETVNQLMKAVEDASVQALDKAGNNCTRSALYRKINEEIIFVMEINDKLKAVINQVMNDLTTKINSVVSRLADHCKQLQKHLNEILREKEITTQQCDQFGFEFDQLSVIAEVITIPGIAVVGKECHSSIVKDVWAKIDELEKNLVQLRENKRSEIVVDIDEPKADGGESKEPPVSPFIRKIGEALIVFDGLSHLHEQFEKSVFQRIETYLKSKEFSSDDVANLSSFFNESPEGNALLHAHTDIFGSAINQLRNKRTANVTYKTALDLLEGTDYDKERMASAIEEFDEEYKKLINASELAILSRTEIEKHVKSTLLAKIREITKDLSPPGLTDKIKWNKSILDAALKILPIVLAMQTILSPKFTWLVHPVQVISILRVLRADKKHNDLGGRVRNAGDMVAGLVGMNVAFSTLENHLLQIGTGEGKSVTLAITACIFGLLGYDVRCACYSKYLSERDQAAFQNLFDILGFKEGTIVYGTFGELAEKFINLHGDMREKMTAIVKSKKSKGPAVLPLRPQILLVDEVDVFLTPSFYCDTYNPIGEITHPSISDLANFIWNESSKSGFSFETHIKKCKPLNICLSVYSGWNFLITKAAENMCIGALIVRQNRAEKHHFYEETFQIGYKIHDTIDTNTSYGYQTLFLYFKECEDRNLPKDKARAKSSISIDCGHFLYSELCKAFAGVIGVSGTLKQLTPTQSGALKRVFNVAAESFIPSAYGDRSLRFTFPANDPEFVQIIEKKELFHHSVLTEIEKRIGTSAQKRAVLVFFDDGVKLKKFSDFARKTLEEKGYKVQLMTELDTPFERNSHIRGAVTAGTITLSVKDLGRGTDFVCYDSKLDGSGGIHVIQTFFSGEKSEEIQIQGRTARDVNHGSYSLVLSSDDLINHYQVTLEDLQAINATSLKYTKLDEIRTKKSDEEFAKLVIETHTKELHEESMKLRSTENVETIKAYLRQI